MDPTKAQTTATFAHLKKEKANKVNIQPTHALMTQWGG